MARRNIKDAVFRKLFTDKVDVARLYTELGGKEQVSASDISLIGLDPVLRKGVVNDLAFFIEGRALYIVEAQSRDDPLILMRCMLYYNECVKSLMKTYGEDVESLLEVDGRVVVVYPGVGKHAPYGEVLYLDDIPLKFSKYHYFKPMEIGKQTLVYQYIGFCNKVNKIIRGDNKGRAALMTLFDECVGEDILSEFLKEHRGEIMDLYFQLTDVDYNHMLDVERGEAEGMAKGMAVGKAEGKAEIVVNMAKNGQSAEQISQLTGIDLSTVESILARLD
ncbi:MAG: hypothetical protein IJ856_02920 [Candidatus Methanomethylophilaceae archaeon]|nr:hypothetical protein [Candidatus Methanomethylophilaceae archaeon]